MTTGTLTIRLLGNVEVARDGREVPDLGHRGRGVIAMLALSAGQVVSTEVLLDTIWGSDASRNTLQATVSRLRRALGAETILGRRPGYVLRTDPQNVDALRFAQLVADSRDLVPALAQPLLDEACGLWAGAALDGVEGAPGLARIAEELTESRHETEERLAAALLRLDEAARAAAVAMAALERDPTRERTALLAIEALGTAGRRGEALAAYRLHAAALRRDLGVEPSAQARAAEATLLHGAHAVGGRRPRSGRLPLLGRVAEMAALTAAHEEAAQGAAVCVVVHGPPGAGASRLLDAWSAQHDDVSTTVARPAESLDPGVVLDRLDPGARTWVIDQADYIDETTAVAIAERWRRGGYATVLAHRDTEGDQPTWRRLEHAARDLTTLVRLRLRPLTARDLGSVLDEASADKVVAATGGMPWAVQQALAAAARSGNMVRAEGGTTSLVPGHAMAAAPDPVPDGPDGRIVELLAAAGHPLSAPVMDDLLDGPAELSRLEEAGLVVHSGEGASLVDLRLIESVSRRMGAAAVSRLRGRIGAALVRAGWDGSRPGLVGAHLLAGGDSQTAAPLLLTAAQRALEDGALRAADEHADRTLQAIGEGADGALAVEAHLVRARARKVLGPADECIDAAKAALRSAASDDQARAALVLIAESEIALGHLDEAQRHLSAALELVSPDDAVARYVRLTQRMAEQAADTPADLDAVRAELETVQAVDSGGDVALAFHQAGWLALERGAAARAVEWFSRALDTPGSPLGDRPEGLFTRMYLGRALVLAGQPGRGLRLQDELMREARSAGLAFPLLLTRTGRADSLMLIGASDAALEEAQRATQLALLHTPAFEAVVRFRLVRALLASGEFDAASRELANVEAGLGSAAVARAQPRVRQLHLELNWMRNGAWDAQEAAALCDRFQQRSRIQAHVEVLTLIARAEHRAEAATEAAAIAGEAGLRLHRIAAAHAGALWATGAGAEACRDARTVMEDLDTDLAVCWRRRPEVAAALESSTGAHRTVAQRESTG